MNGDQIMSESRDGLSGRQSAAEAAAITLTFDDRRARWQEKGTRHDARVAWHMRLIAAIALTIGIIWASAPLLS